MRWLLILVLVVACGGPPTEFTHVTIPGHVTITTGETTTTR